ncbi:MAG: hypothetical protein KDA81_21870, partial [Planctomycetaceae bacterium]|nr:hypothetical protein [Planctomycetaceae bacterium]
GETLLPGRIVGGDHFNPFTNTVHLYSNVPSIGIHEAAHAKDFAQRTWKGTYAAAYLLPGAPLYHEAKATGDAVGYLTATHDVSAQKEALHILYPAYGSYVGNAISGNVPVGYVAGVIGGHIVGRWKAWELGRHPAHSTTRPNVEFQQAAGTQPADEPSRVSHAVDYR